ncbi:hypothetical protein [Parerythrobacter jejuensis]|uniref:Uncharacterized protein n=1 Tax=Parerythrobacter jejuensis TaxID=795812 RepID=A0A845AVS5_9SPHN|nr:hypothetical protein [Parerythrobacter jejuensis]MXP32606.1 hypothetical protein [Parerythrobacter jejuensis]
MITRRRFLIVWIGGVIAFAIAAYLHLPLAIDTVPSGITAHQTAGNAARVDYVQSSWAEAGVLRNAFTAMTSDLIFIALYGFGSLLGGLYFLKVGTGTLRIIGWALLASAIIFLATDFTETILQLQQLMAGAGDDRQAALAAAMYYPKAISWIACFVLPLNGIFLDLNRKSAA